MAAETRTEDNVCQRAMDVVGVFSLGQLRKIGYLERLRSNGYVNERIRTESFWKGVTDDK